MTNHNPPYLKTIYVLVADDRLGSDKYFKRFAGLLKGAAAHNDELEGWTVEVRKESDAENVLRHVQVRPVDLIILDCSFQITENHEELDPADERKKLLDISRYMFKKNLEFVGLDLYEYLNTAKELTAQMEFDTVLFTSYETSDKEFIRALEDRKLQIKEIKEIETNGANLEVGITDILYLLKTDERALNIFCDMIVNCKRRIESWWDDRDTVTGDKQYLLLYRYLSHKFAHHDWLPEYLQCVRIDDSKRVITGHEVSRENKIELLSFPGWRIYSCGREFNPPDENEDGIFFSFPQNTHVENLGKIELIGKHVKPTIVESMGAFIDYLKQFEGIKKTVVFCGAEKKFSVIDKTNAYKVSVEQIQKPVPDSSSPCSFGGITVRSPLWLAATPLTGSTMAGQLDSVIEHFIDKIQFFLKLGFGAAVLKTVYPVGESKADWPQKDMYSFNQSRCYTKGKDNGTLYNTGSTANEAFPPEVFNDVLIKMKKMNADYCSIIPSLGAHSNDEKIWRDLFDSIFKNCTPEEYPLVEINARHAIREIAKKSGLKGDEYFHLLSSDTAETLARLTEFYSEFKKWLETVAKISPKRSLILKFPYRADLFVFIGICEELRKEHVNICGITLINTFKSPFFSYKQDSPANNPDLKFNNWHDIIKHPQVSGSALAPLRNYILDVLFDRSFVPNQLTLDISASGGIMSEDDVAECMSLGAKSVQIGTSLLKNNRDLQAVIRELSSAIANSTKPTPNLYKRNRDIALRIPGEFERFIKRRVKPDLSKCNRCGHCYSSYYCDAYLNRHISSKTVPVEYAGNHYDLRYPVIDENACVGCGLCVQLCVNKALTLIIPDKSSTSGGVCSAEEKMEYFDKEMVKQCIPQI